MRIRKALFIIGACLITVSFSCIFPSKDVHCPEFDDFHFFSNPLNVWFPYQDHDTVKFIEDGSGATRTFTFDTVTTSNDPDIILRTHKEGCAAIKHAETSEKASNGWPVLSYHLVKRGYSQGVKHEMTLQFLGMQLTSTDIREGEFRQLTVQGHNYYVQHMPSVTLSGKKFYNLVQVRVDTIGASKPSVHKIYFARHQGIVAFETYSPAQRWIKE